MISPKTQTNLANAKTYFEDHLTRGDYYSQGKHTAGTWFGKAAEALGLHVIVQEEQFLAMCKGINPNTGEPLIARTKNLRREMNSKRRSASWSQLGLERWRHEQIAAEPLHGRTNASIRLLSGLDRAD